MLLIRNDQMVIKQLNDLFASWKSDEEDDFGGKIGQVRLLGVRHGSDGVKNEMLQQYIGWL